MAPKDKLVERYPEIMRGATAWCWSDKWNGDRQRLVTEDGLRRLLRLIQATQRAVFDASMRLSDSGGKMKDGIHLPGNVAVDLMNRTSEVFCEGDLIVSGLFVDDDGPVISRSTEVPLLGTYTKANPAPAGNKETKAEDPASAGAHRPLF